jgi:hypothetical protein
MFRVAARLRLLQPSRRTQTARWHRAAASTHPAFVVADLAAMPERFAAAGHPVQDDHSGPTVDRGYVHDPFGNRSALIDAASAGFSRRTT